MVYHKLVSIPLGSYENYIMSKKESQSLSENKRKRGRPPGIPNPNGGAKKLTPEQKAIKQEIWLPPDMREQIVAVAGEDRGAIPQHIIRKLREFYPAPTTDKPAD